MPCEYPAVVDIRSGRAVKVGRAAAVIGCFATAFRQKAFTVSIGNLLFVFASAFSIMLTGSFTVTKFADSDLRMGGPPVKVLVCCGQFDISSFTGIEVSRSCRAEFFSV
jgi:hypothetical protein